MAKDQLSKEQVQEMLLLVAERIIGAEQQLTDADRNLGDGDHGLGMTRGQTAVKEKLTGAEFPSVDKVFTTAGMAMISSMGGASGAIFGTVYRGGGKALAGCESFGSAELATLLKAALEGVMERGGAKPGDKTMIDALASGGGESGGDDGGFAGRGNGRSGQRLRRPVAMRARI